MPSSRHLVAIFLFSVAIPVAITQGQSANYGAIPRGTSSTCKIAGAPRADSADHLAGAQEAIHSRIESGCSDDRSSTRIATAGPAEGQAAPTNPPDSAPRTTALTLTCHFSSGPRAGEIGDLTGAPGEPAVPVGSVCSDGASTGTALVRDTSATTFAWSGAIRASDGGAIRASSTICQFMSGPKAHGWHDYAPLPPAPLGSSCQDGVRSAGIVVASGHGEQY